MKHCIIFITIIIGLLGCSLAPKYERPEMIIPADYKESGEWLQATPSRSELHKGPWWEMYGDPILNELEARINVSNQNLKAAVARYENAVALANVARSYYYPTITGIGNASRQQESSNSANVAPVLLFNDVVVGANLSYEIDVWDRVRNSVIQAESIANASKADLIAIDLSLHAQLAALYFTIRGDDAAIKILSETVQMYEKALYLTQQRYKGAIATIADVDQAENQLETAKTTVADFRLQRMQNEHAIAVLIGEAPASFTLKPTNDKGKLVTAIPPLASTLVERRPDIAAAEQLVQAANANIGVARAAFFPNFNFTGGIGFDSATLAKLIEAPSLLWALGPSSVVTVFNSRSLPLAMQTIFDGGRIRSVTEQAWAIYFEAVAAYRQTVLTALQEVEDGLVAVRELDQENQTQTKAKNAAVRALQQAMYRYKGGLITYLEVVVPQNIALQAELAVVDIQTRRQVASVNLIKALGGGWTEDLLQLNNVSAEAQG